MLMSARRPSTDPAAWSSSSGGASGSGAPAPHDSNRATWIDSAATARAILVIRVGHCGIDGIALQAPSYARTSIRADRSKRRDETLVRGPISDGEDDLVEHSVNAARERAAKN